VPLPIAPSQFKSKIAFINEGIDKDIVISLGQSTNLRLVLYNPFGNEIELYDGYIESEIFRRKLSTMGLKRGVYYLRIYTDFGVKIEKFVIK